MIISFLNCRKVKSHYITKSISPALFDIYDIIFVIIIQMKNLDNLCFEIHFELLIFRYNIVHWFIKKINFKCKE